MNRTKWLLVVSLVAVSAIVGIVITYASQVSMLYLEADEVFARLDRGAATQHKEPGSLVGTYLRIHGSLHPKTTRRYRGRQDYEFQIADKNKRTLKVTYSGILPDTFRDNADLVIEGRLVRPDLFEAYSVFAKCPTKYMEDKAKTKKPKTVPTI